MIGLDTNVLVRYLVQDDGAQSAKATELIERHLSHDSPGFLSAVVMAETIWVLERAYRFTDEEIVATIERILETDVFVVESEQQVFAAMVALKEGLGSFPDALIGAVALKAGCSRTVTFDQKASRIPGFELL